MPKEMPFQNTFLTSFAQFILLYHLQKELLNGSTIQQLSEKFSQSYDITSRAIRNLENFELINFTGSKNKQIEFVANGEKLWELAQDFFQNPVERKLFTDQTLSKEQACLSNINALSEYSMLNDEVQQTYAVYKKDVKSLPIETNKHFGDNMVEVWRYNPRPLSENGFVDKLSLYLLFKNDDDPRIQIELERRILKEMQWLEE
jgi:DNA-binding transcriptional regulator GbsR (MarR family)